MERRAISIILLLVLFIAPSHAQSTDSSGITLEQLFSSDYFYPEWFGPAKWMQSGTAYTTLESSSEIEGGQDLVQYDAETGAPEVLIAAADLVPPDSTAPLWVEDYTWSPDGSKLLIYTNSARVWRLNTRGDYWVFDLPGRHLRQIGGDAEPSTLMFAKFSPEGRRVAYVRENNLYVEDLEDGNITQLTSDGSRTTVNGTFDWVYEEEFSLRDGSRWSPDGKQIAYWQLDATGVRDFLLINNTDSLYSFTIPIQYPKAGTTNSAARVGVVSASGGTTQWMEVPGDPRDNYIPRLEWGGDSSKVFLVQLNRLQNTAHLMFGDVNTGQVRTVFTDQDSTWLEIGNQVGATNEETQWMEGGKRFTWVSERDGWRHLYAISKDGAAARLLTPGAFDVADVVTLDDEGGWLYYIASPENPSQRYLFRRRLDGQGEPERLSPANQPGTHSYDMGPGATYALHTYSSFGTPPIVELIRLPAHETVRTLVDNDQLLSRVTALKRGPVDFFRIDIGDRLALDGWMMHPPNFDSTKKYPILFYVYGEPFGQTVLDRWSWRYLWHLMLTQQGYIVASVDNRGTPSLRGRDWRKVIYGTMGVHASQEQAATARALAHARPYVDSTRIGVWGWSGGGSMTLNLLFRHPELYRMGMAVAPVPDQRLYDTIYQERYMGLPQENEEGYRQGSPITFAHQLQGDLLLIHGTGDDNVHYQGTERLIDALIAANKPFTMMIYPNRSHDIYEGENTRRHLYELLTRYLHEHLPLEPLSQSDGVIGALKE